MIVITRNEDIDCRVKERLIKLACWDKIKIHGSDKSSFSDLSSSLIRKMVKDGKSIKYLVADGVVDFIKKKGLYK